MQKLLNKAALIDYDSGEYVYHGSPTGTITELEPRQSYSFGKPDGESAISASKDIRPAVFMALFSNGFGSAMGTFPTDDNPFGMVISQSAWDEVHNKDVTGFVYVLNAKDFTLRDEGGWELRATKAVKPVAVVEINKDDLPEGITIKKDDDVADYIDGFRTGIS